MTFNVWPVHDEAVFPSVGGQVATDDAVCDALRGGRLENKMMPFIACVTGVLMSGECSSETLPVPRNHRVSAVGSPRCAVSGQFSLKIEIKLCARQMVTVMFLTQSHAFFLLPQVRS